MQLPGALAVQSGGTMIADNEALNGDEAGRRLAAAASAPVLWPTTVAWPAEMAEVLPKQTPPLRGDRETVLIGTLKGKAPSNVEVTVESAAGPQKLAFAIPPSTSDENNSYLVKLIEQARTDGGVTLPLVGSASLAEARQEINAGVHNLVRLAREALSAGNVAGAERLAGEALRGDPNDSEALDLKAVLAKRPLGGAPAVAAAPVAGGAAAKARAARRATTRRRPAAPRT